MVRLGWTGLKGRVSMERSNLNDVRVMFGRVMTKKAEVEKLTFELRDEQRELKNQLINANLEECLTINFSMVRRYLNANL
jgi:hypothetical protein